MFNTDLRSHHRDIEYWGRDLKYVFLDLKNMERRDEEAVVEAVAIDRLIELSTTDTWIHQQKVGAVDRRMDFRFWAYSSQFWNLFLIQILGFWFSFFSWTL